MQRYEIVGPGPMDLTGTHRYDNLTKTLNMSLGKLTIEALAQKLRAMEDGWRTSSQPGVFQEVSTAVGMLRMRRLHEWVGVQSGLKPLLWIPPMAILMHAAEQAAKLLPGKLVIWIGRAVWPYPVGLEDGVLANSVLLDLPRVSGRIPGRFLGGATSGGAVGDSGSSGVLRSSAVAAVVMDGSGLNLQATRCLQLAAEAGSALVMITRPPSELAIRSAAAYRWHVKTLRSVNGCPRWQVELVRSKDAMGAAGAKQQKVVEWRHGQSLIAATSLVANRVATTRRTA